MKFYGKGEGNKLRFFDRKALDEFIPTLNGQNIVLDLTAQGNYSGSQWGYLHAICGIFAKELNKLGGNFTTEKIKDLLRMKCPELRETEYVDGVVLGDRLKSTKELSKEQMASVIQTAIAWASEYSIELPEPRTQIKADL